MNKFTGIMTPLPTPFTDDFRLKDNTVREIMKMHIENGISGSYVCGGTGEGVGIPDKLRMEMCETVIDEAKGKKPVIVHVGAAKFSSARELAYTPRNAARTALQAYRRFTFHTTEPMFTTTTKSLQRVLTFPL